MACALAADPISQLEENLECTVCLEVLKDPRTLPCCHSFCKDCLEGVVKACRDKAPRGRPIREIPCPTCRATFTLDPDKHVVDMPRNHFICNMVKATAVLDRGTGVPCSHNCTQSYSVARCVTCEKFLCRECLTIHNSYRGHNGHSVLTMEELSKPENREKINDKMYCNEHSGMILKVYCETCDQLICRDCMDFKHLKQSHSCFLVKDVANNYKELLASNNKAMEDALTEGNTFVQRLSLTTQQLDRDAEDAKNKIAQRKAFVAKKVIEMLDQKAETLLNKVDEVHEVRRANLDRQTGEAKLYVENIKASVQLSKKLVDQGTEEEIISSQKMILDNANNLLTKREEYFKAPLPVTKLSYSSFTSKEPINEEILRGLADSLEEVNERNKVAKKVAGSEKVFRGKVLDVKLQSLETNATIEKSGEECTEKERTIVVSDLPEGATENNVWIHFQKKKNSGGEVEKVALLPENRALVVFQDPEVASRIVATPQQMKGKLLTIGLLNIKESSPEVKTPEMKGVNMTPEVKTASEVKTSPEVITPEVKAEETATLESVGLSEPDRTSEAELKIGKGRQVEERATAAGISLVSIDAMVSTALQYFLSNNVKLFVYQGDLTQEKVDVIVNPANERLEHCHGAAEAILKAGGRTIQSESNAIMRKRRKDLSAGEVEITAAGRLPSKLIVHAVGPRRSEHDKDSAKKCLYNAVMNSLKIASKNGAESISIPAISSGVFGIPVDFCASVLFNAVEDFAKDKRLVNKLQEIRFVNIDKPTTDEFVKEMTKRYSTNIKRETRVDGSLLSTANSSTKTAGKDAERQIAAMNLLMPSPPSNGHDKSKITDPKGSSGDDKCSICLSDFTDKKTLHKCGHSFCSGCIDKAFNHQKKCPVCSMVYGPLIGNQPPGKMNDSAQPIRLPSYESCGTIVIVYTFDGGVQGENHPNPGQRYTGTTRRAYLPDNEEGRKVLRLLRKAFDQKLTFTIGRSSTIGSNNVITWNDIHHKTNMKGGPTNFGYPDPDYLKRVQEELAAKGITE